MPSRANKQFRSPAIYRDKKTGRFVSQFTWKRSKARGGSRYVRQRARRDIYVLGFDGYVPVSVRSSKQAHLASEHLIAVGKFIGQIPSGQAGTTELLKPFIGKSVGGVGLLTDPDRLYELAEAGLIKLDALYRNNRAGRHEK